MLLPRTETGSVGGLYIDVSEHGKDHERATHVLRAGHVSVGIF
jgi:hypothetical protein